MAAHALSRGFASASAPRSAFGFSPVAAGSALDTILRIFSPPSHRTPLAAAMPQIWRAKDFQPSLLFSKAAVEGPAERLRGYDITSYSGGGVHHTSFCPRCSRGPDERLHMNSGDGFGPCRNHLCADILCSIAVTSISPTDYSKLKGSLPTYLGTPVALRSTFRCLSWFSIVSDRPWMYNLCIFRLAHKRI